MISSQSCCNLKCRTAPFRVFLFQIYHALVKSMSRTSTCVARYEQGNCKYAVHNLHFSRLPVELRGPREFLHLIRLREGFLYWSEGKDRVRFLCAEETGEDEWSRLSKSISIYCYFGLLSESHCDDKQQPRLPSHHLGVFDFLPRGVQGFWKSGISVVGLSSQ